MSSTAGWTPEKPMSVKHPENFVSAVYRVGTTVGTAMKQRNAAATRADEIGGLVADARRQYRTERYEDAIESYERARSLIYQLLHPTYRPRRGAEASITLPVGPAVEAKVAEAGLRLAESMKPDVVSPNPPVRVFDVDVPEPVSRFDAIGFADVKTAGDVGLAVEFAIEQIATKQPGAAVETLRTALDGLGDPDADRAAAGVITLNLSSAYTQQGEYETAVEAAREASQHFAAVGDDVGRAQAQHNIAVANELAGEEEAAETAFSESTRLFASAAERLHGRSGGATISTPEPGRSGGGSVVLPDRSGGSTRIGGNTRFGPFDGFSDRIIRPDGGATMAAGPQVLEARTDLQSLEFVGQRDRDTLAVRWPGESGGWSGVPLTTPAEEAGRTMDWTLGTTAGNDVVELTWTDGRRPSTNDLVDGIYRPRIDATALSALEWHLVHPGDTSAYLLQIYSFVVPRGLGDCYHELGNFARAEEFYLQAASYSYLNRRFEVPALWVRIAENVLAWGDYQYRHEELDACRETYAKLVTREGTVPESSPLFAVEAFETVAGRAREVVETIRTMPETDLEAEAEPGSVLDALGDVNPDVARPILVVWSRWQYLLARLDFYGTSFTPAGVHVRLPPGRRPGVRRAGHRRRTGVRDVQVPCGGRGSHAPRTRERGGDGRGLPARVRRRAVHARTLGSDVRSDAEHRRVVQALGDPRG
ncbi:MAG: tetratricopeptide repeat protein [Haloarculaceae archaeon]